MGSPNQASIDDLAAHWRSRPDARVTIALCEALRTAPQGTLVEEVGARASRDYAGDAAVLLATARMYIAAQRLGDAQTVLVAAGKAAPRDGQVYRFLGEVLLRRGDADRAVRVFERALHFGASDPETRIWSDRAKVFKSMQATSGMRAVANEVQRTAPLEVARPAMESLTDTTTEVKVVKAPALGRADDDDDELTRRPAPIPNSIRGAKDPRTNEPREPARAPAFSPSRAAPNTGPNLAALPLGGDDEPSVTAELPRDLPRHREDPPKLGDRSESARLAGGNLPKLAERPKFNKDADTAPPFAPIGAAPPLPPPPPRDPFAGANKPAAVARPITPLVPLTNGAPVATEPRDVLDALEIAGIFEPHALGGGAAVAWDPAAKKPRSKGFIALIVATVLFVGGTVGLFTYVRDKRAKEHEEAELILTKVEATLHAGNAADLPAAEQSLSHVFDLDSRSPRAALEWLRERALLGLLKGGGDIAFEDAMTRAQEVGVKESDVAFARVASFLFQNDTVGAAALLPKWDDKAAKEPWYQLLAGATLARAGDAHSIDRFAAAAELDPDLVIAQIALARAMALDGDPAKAMERAKVVKVKFPGRPEGPALVTLAWARDPTRGDVAPPDADQTIKSAPDLPVLLQFIPHAAQALHAIATHDLPAAKDEIQKGLAVADGPGVAAWLGSIALDTGDEQLARKGALAAVSFSAVYPPARMLAARVALLGARLDDALKATEELDPTSPDVAVVRGAVAYERLDMDGLARALEAVPADAQKIPFLATIQLAPDVLVGGRFVPAEKLVDLADDEAPWSDLVAMDAALDQGSMEQADAIAAQWKGGEDRPLRALRLSRLSRYESRLDAAEAASLVALNAGTVTPRVLAERVFVLVARNKGADAGPLLAKYPLVLGPLGRWLSAYVAASQGKVEEAKARTSTLDPPPAAAPLEARVIAASALAAMHERQRAADVLKPLLSGGYVGFDIQTAAIAAGFKRVEHRTRPPTFEAP